MASVTFEVQDGDKEFLLRAKQQINNLVSAARNGVDAAATDAQRGRAVSNYDTFAAVERLVAAATVGIKEGAFGETVNPVGVAPGVAARAERESGAKTFTDEVTPGAGGEAGSRAQHEEQLAEGRRKLEAEEQAAKEASAVMDVEGTREESAEAPGAEEEGIDEPVYEEGEEIEDEPTDEELEAQQAFSASEVE
jgi:hypothetical protein